MPRTLLVCGWVEFNFHSFSLRLMLAFCCSSVHVRLRLRKQEEKIVQKYQMRYTRAQLIFYFSSLFALSLLLGVEERLQRKKILKTLRNKLFAVNVAHATLNDNKRIYSRKTKEVNIVKLRKHRSFRLLRVTHSIIQKRVEVAQRHHRRQDFECESSNVRRIQQRIFHLNHFYFITHRQCSKKFSGHQKLFSAAAKLD